MKPIAYSYTRFSTIEQKKGKSRERQDEAAVQWCNRKNVILDTELTLHDAGVSAFRGKNVVTGALGSFLKAAHAGAVQRGAYLLIETFDRLSREAAYDAQLTLQNIINAGITVVTLLDGKEYNVQILRADPLALIYAILLMSRAHEESATKAKRVADAWRRKRAEARRGHKKLTRTVPGWIDVDGHGKFKLNTKAKVVERIFELFAAGKGFHSIAMLLNEERVPTLRDAGCWHLAVVRSVLRSRTVIGEIQPHHWVMHDGKHKRTPEGDSIKNYYPAAIRPRLFEQAQRRFKQTSRIPHSNGKSQLKNILAGLARCPQCDRVMIRVNKADNSPRLVCCLAKNGVDCERRSIMLKTLEFALTSNAVTLVAQIPVMDGTLHARIQTAEQELRAAERKLDDLSLLLDDTPSRVLAERIKTAEGECEQLRIELDALQAQAQYGNARRIKDKAQVMREALLWFAQSPTEVEPTNTALRECFSKIMVDIPGRAMTMHWRHGGEAVIKY